MTLESGAFGTGRFGAAVFGFKMFGVLCSGNFFSQELLDVVNQNGGTNREMQEGQPVGATVLIDGVDQTEIVESVRVKNTTLESAKTAEITFIGGSVPGFVLRESIVEVFFNYELESGKFTGMIFSGKARKQKVVPNAVGESVTVSLFDLSHILDEHAPRASDYTGTALNLIRTELAMLGFDTVNSTLKDYSVTAITPSATWGTVREMINDLVSGRIPGYSYLGVDGVFNICSALTIEQSAWVLPLSAQFVNEKAEDSRGVFNYVVATNAGLVQSYTDYEHIAVNGVLGISVKAPFCDTAFKLLTFATNYAEESQTASRIIECSVIPFIEPGALLTVETTDGTALVRLQESEISFSWPSGPTQKIVVKEIPVIPPIAITPELAEVIFTNYIDLVATWKLQPNFIRERPNHNRFSGSELYPQFQVLVAKKIHYIDVSLDADNGLESVNVTLENVGTSTQYGPFELPPSNGWAAVFSFFSSTGTEIPAGTYRIVCDETYFWNIKAYFIKASWGQEHWYDERPYAPGIASVRGVDA